MRVAFTLAVVGLTAGLAACADGPRAVANKEDMMIASGFRFVPANTPERQAAFRQLPPHKFTRQTRGDKTVYVYADPTVCVCLYVGTPAQYAAYRARVFDKQLADEQSMTANDYRMAPGWDWGPWGVGYPMGWPYNY